MKALQRKRRLLRRRRTRVHLLVRQQILRLRRRKGSAAKIGPAEYVTIDRIRYRYKFNGSHFTVGGIRWRERPNAAYRNLLRQLAEMCEGITIDLSRFRNEPETPVDAEATA